MVYKSSKFSHLSKIKRSSATRPLIYFVENFARGAHDLEKVITKRDIRSLLKRERAHERARKKGRCASTDLRVPHREYRPCENGTKSQRWKQTSRNYECTFAKDRRMKRKGSYEGVTGGRVRGLGGDDEARNQERWASSCRYYSVNANVNTPRDVFRKARISRRLLILVIAGTCTSDALNGLSLREEERG